MYLQVEDKAQDGAYLFMVSQGDSLLETDIWSKVVKVMSRFGVHSAVLSCVQNHG